MDEGGFASGSECKNTGVAKRRTMKPTREAAEKLQVDLISKVHNAGFIFKRDTVSCDWLVIGLNESTDHHHLQRAEIQSSDPQTRPPSGPCLRLEIMLCVYFL